MDKPTHVVRPFDEADTLALLPMIPDMEEHACVGPAPQEPLVVLLLPWDIPPLFAPAPRRDRKDIIMERRCGGRELRDNNPMWGRPFVVGEKLPREKEV